MTMHEAIDAYLDFLRVERGLSSATISAYRSDLLGFASFVESGGYGDWERDPRAAREFLAALGRPPHVRRPATHRRKAASIRAFYRFLFTEELIGRDVAGLLDLPRQQRQLPDTLDRAQVEAILDAPDAATADGLRERALLELLYACGLRISEALRLDVDDLSLREATVQGHRQG